LVDLAALERLFELLFFFLGVAIVFLLVLLTSANTLGGGLATRLLTN